MAIPEWTEFGLLPQGIHECSFEEIENRLGFNPQRVDLISGLSHVMDWLNSMPPIHSLVIDGSFVTDKPTPSDIDAVAMIHNLTERNQREWVRMWQPQHSGLKSQFNIDLYPTTAGVGNDFSAFFQYLRPEEALERGAPLGVLKGLLRIVR